MEQKVYLFLDENDVMITACSGEFGVPEGSYTRKVEFTYTAYYVAFDYVDGNPVGYTHEDMVARVASGEITIE